MSSLTDSTNYVSYDPESRPGVFNLLQLLSHFDTGGRSPAELADVHKDLKLRDFKTRVSEAISGALSGIRESYSRIIAEDAGAYVDHVANEGARKARESAEATMALVREAVGLW